LHQRDYTADRKKGKHLSSEELFKIEALDRVKKSPEEIACEIGCSAKTISRELKRGAVVYTNSDLTTRNGYSADLGVKLRKEASANKGRELKIGKDHLLEKHIIKKIKKDKFSPDVVIGEIKSGKYNFDTTICTKTLYNYIDRDLFEGVSNKDLPVKRNKSKRKYRIVRINKNLTGTSIEKRSEAIETREEQGHWEMDCVVGGKGSQAALLVLTERKTREEIVIKMAAKTQECVIAALDNIEKRNKGKFRNIFKTITVDNGSEFLNHGGLERSAITEGVRRTQIYYAHPYSSWERGTNENNNKLIRRFIPKGTDISKISKKEIKRIQDWMNNYPRRIFGYKTANEMAGSLKHYA